MTALKALKGEMKSTDKPFIFSFQIALITAILVAILTGIFLMLGVDLSNFENTVLTDITMWIPKESL